MRPILANKRPRIYRPQRRAVSHAIATSIHHVIKRKIGYYIGRLSHFMIDSFWIDQRVLCGGTYHTFHALTQTRLTDGGTINMDVPFKLRRLLNGFLHDSRRYCASISIDYVGLAFSPGWMWYPISHKRVDFTLNRHFNLLVQINAHKFY